MSDDRTLDALPLREVIARIIDPVSFEKVRQHQEPGGPEVPSDAAWRCNRARDKAAHIEVLCASALIEVRNVLTWMEERGRNSKSYGSHADAYEIAARKLREAMEVKSAEGSQSISEPREGEPQAKSEPPQTTGQP